MKLSNSLEKYLVSVICRIFADSMESDTSYGDFMVKLIRRLSGNFIYYVFSMETPDNLQINFTTKSP